MKQTAQVEDLIAQRIEFAGIGEEDSEALRTFAPVLEEHIDALLDAFYAHVTAVPQLKALFRDAAHVEMGRAAQKRHWLDNIFTGRFDDQYVRSVTAVGQAHARIGLEPRWYIGAYCFVLTGLQRLAGETYADDRDQENRVTAAINKAVFLDMDLAISVYIDAARDRTRKILNEHAEHFETNVKQVVTSVAATAAQLKGTAEAVSSAAEESISQSGNVSVAAEQCEAAIHEIREKVSRSTDITQRAVQLATTAESSISGLNSSADAISEFSKTISDIAGQTNLLALNATIEAARAGDAGRGFAVVANEVKALAQQTAKATEEIAARLETIQSEVRTTTGAINDVAQTINQIDGLSQEISNEMSEQELAMREVASNVTGIQGAAGHTGEASAETLQATSTLAEQSQILEERVDAFLEEVRQSG
ncbi:MAG: globin-coupled sensor protein [Parvibaculaceae bacterium]